MRNTNILLVIFFLALACSEQKNESSKKLSGSKIYTLYCQQCHGNTGNLGLNGASNFTQSTLSLEERINVIANGRKTMLPYKTQLSPSQIKAVAEYTMKL